jgi:hypothetical protein
MAIVTNDFAKALYPGVNEWYGDEYNQHDVEYSALFDKETSSRNFEEDVGLTGFGLAVVKPEGGSITYDSQRQGFTTRYTHITYGLGFIVTREMFEDDLYKVVGKKRAKALAMSMRQTKETVGANVYNRFATSGYTGGDGVVLGSASHPNVTGGTWSNLESAASLSEASIETLCINLAAATNDRGLKIALKPMQLVIPPALMFEAERILKTQQRVGTANNDINAIKAKGIFSKGYTVNHWLTSTTAWFVRTNASDGLKYFERRGDNFDIDNDFDTENAKFKATGRYSFGWTDPRAIWCNAGA